MAAINFPDSPLINDIFLSNGRSWKWTGLFWEFVGQGDLITIDSIPPANPTNGSQWFDTVVERLNIYYGDRWITLATIDDTLTVPNHIHDENGLVVSTFVDGGGLEVTPQGTIADGGTPFTTDWENTFSGGFAVSNYS